MTGYATLKTRTTFTLIVMIVSWINFKRGELPKWDQTVPLTLIGYVDTSYQEQGTVLISLRLKNTSYFGFLFFLPVRNSLSY
jgi:hypothetical protein